MLGELAYGKLAAAITALLALFLAGLGPSLVQLFVIFPLSTPFGVGGVGLGAATPVFVLLFNSLGWSLPAYAWFLLLQSGECGPAMLVLNGGRGLTLKAKPLTERSKHSNSPVQCIHKLKNPTCECIVLVSWSVQSV